MLLTIHIITATINLILAGVLYFRPSESKLYTTYFMTAAMLATGTALVFAKPVHITQTCLTGLAYLSLITYNVVSARKRMAQQ